MNKRKQSMNFLTPSVKPLGNGIEEIWQNFSKSGKYCQDYLTLEENLTDFKASVDRCLIFLSLFCACIV
ncbi:MAG: hypothetical protein LBL38_01375 [Lactobacillales bacterium]|jgi:hypothetical protein|nr:hypothetical protein [Lactobacillales bacterium]